MSTNIPQDSPLGEATAQNADTPMVRNNRVQQNTNPYDRKPSYKDVLLSKVTDDSNRMGINTFQLLHLLNKSRNQEQNLPTSEWPHDDGQSINSETTETQANEVDLKYYCMRLQFTLDETSPETYMEDVATHLNRIVVAPWYKMDKISKEELLTEMSDDPLDAVKYLYGFKVGKTKMKMQYLRIHIAFPSHYEVDEIVKKNKSSIMIPGKQTFLKANSQCVHPVTIGWFLRSTPMMADFNDLSRVLKACWSVLKGDFGLYWATVRDGKPYDPTQATRAIHVEVEEAEAASIVKWAEKMYG